MTGDGGNDILLAFGMSVIKRFTNKKTKLKIKRVNKKRLSVKRKNKQKSIKKKRKSKKRFIE